MSDYSNFLRLNPDKQQNIINAALEVFGENGYNKTSMQDIANKANISKPSLFYYFGTKNDLYLFLYKFSCDKIISQMTEGGEDFFDCLMLSSKIKLKVMKSYPGLYSFLLSIVKEENAEILKQLEEYNAEDVAKSAQMLFKNVNWDKFIPDIDKETIFKTVSYISSGFIKDHIKDDPEDIINKIQPILMLFKRAVYKEEYL